MPLNVAQKLITTHLADGSPRAGTPIRLKIDQTLTQDATGTLVMLTLEALGLRRVSTEVSAQYVDHNLLQVDNLNADDHRFLESACRRFGIWYSPPGTGISHVVHMQRFGVPGKSLLGSDSHTPAAGALGMLAIGAGGLDVALAMSGEPLPTTMPAILGVRLTGAVPDWVSAKDVILEMLRRRGVSGGVGKIIEYFGPGLQSLGAMDRHVIANMGAELGATSTVFPSDKETHRFLERQHRGGDWREILADGDCRYDDEDEIDLSKLEPLIATPSSPGNVVAVREIEGKDIYQAYIGSSANPGWRDFAIAAEIVIGKSVAPRTSFDVNPTSRQLLQKLIADGARRFGSLGGADSSDRLQRLYRHGAGARGRAELVAYDAAQFSRALRHRGGFGFSLLAGNGGCLSAARPYHRSALAADAVSAARRAPRWDRQCGFDGGTTARDRGAVGGADQGTEHSFSAGVRSASRRIRSADSAEGGRRRIYRRNPAGGRKGAALSLQRTEDRRVCF